MQELVTEELIHEVAAGILEKDWVEIEKKLEAAKGFAKTIHVDIADGKLVNNISFLDPKPFAPYARDLILEVHLMVEDPIKYLKPFAAAGFKRFIGHIEKMPDIAEFVAQGQLLGEVGLGIDTETQVDVLKVSLDDLDCLLVMTVKAGFSGQGFMESQLEKVKKLREKTMIPIEVDGGIKDTTILFAKEAGANRFVATSFIWSSEDPKSAYLKLASMIKSS